MIGNFYERWAAHGEPKVGDLMFFGFCAFGTMYLVLRITRLTKTRAICSHFQASQGKWVEHASFMLGSKKEVSYAPRIVTPFDKQAKEHLAKSGKPLLHPETVSKEYLAVEVRVTGWRGKRGDMKPIYEVSFEGRKYTSDWWSNLTTGQVFSRWEQWIVCSEESAMVPHWRVLKKQQIIDKLDAIIIARQQSGKYDDDEYPGNGERPCGS